MAEIQRSPVKVGKLSHYLQGEVVEHMYIYILYIYICMPGGCLGFLNDPTAWPFDLTWIYKKTTSVFAFMTTVKIQDHLPEWGWDFSEKSTVCQLPHAQTFLAKPTMEGSSTPSPGRSTCHATKSEWRIWNQNLPRKNLSEDEKPSEGSRVKQRST